MLANVFAIVLTNTFFWFGGQGYCAYDFVIEESGDEFTNVEIVMRPIYDPDATATGKTTLPDEVISIETLGGARAYWGTKTTLETDCEVTGFEVISGKAFRDGKLVDLLEEGLVEIGQYEPLKIEVKGK